MLSTANLHSYIKVKLVDPGPSRPEGHTIAEHANWLPEYTVGMRNRL